MLDYNKLLKADNFANLEKDIEKNCLTIQLGTMLFLQDTSKIYIYSNKDGKRDWHELGADQVFEDVPFTTVGPVDQFTRLIDTTNKTYQVLVHLQYNLVGIGEKDEYISFYVGPGKNIERVNTEMDGVDLILSAIKTGDIWVALGIMFELEQTAFQYKKEDHPEILKSIKIREVK